MVRKQIGYVGRVQGVGFRARVEGLARGRGVSGWVRNEDDGGVTLEAQGGDRDVRAFVDAIGSEMGTLIRSANVTDIAIVANETGFEVRR